MGKLKLFGKMVIWSCCIFTAAVCLSMYTSLPAVLARPLLEREDLRRADLIVVLGGGVYRNGALGSASMERAVHGVILYRKGYAAKIFFTGGNIIRDHRKLLHTLLDDASIKGTGVSEAAVMRDTAMGLGVPISDIVTDETAVNTVENLRRVRDYMGKNGLKTCLLVTSSTHMKRAELIAKKLGIDFSPAGAPDTSQYRLDSFDRLNLMHDVLWEYGGLALYRLYGYI